MLTGTPEEEIKETLPEDDSVRHSLPSFYFWPKVKNDFDVDEELAIKDQEVLAEFWNILNDSIQVYLNKIQTRIGDVCTSLFGLTLTFSIPPPNFVTLALERSFLFLT